MKRFFLLTLGLALLLSACGQTTQSDQTTSDQEDGSAQAQTISSTNYDEMFAAEDLEVGYDTATAVSITFNGSSIQCNSSDVTIKDTTATITKGGTYLLSGTLDLGQVVVNAKGEKVQLVLNGVSITNDTSAAIYVKKADKVFVTLAADSENTLQTTGEFEADDSTNVDGVIFSKSDLTMNGVDSGSLTIVSAQGHGVVSKDNLILAGGNYTIQAAEKGLSGKDSIRIASGTFDLDCGDDGLHADNDEDTALGFLYLAGGTLTVDAKDDGVSATGDLTIVGGDLTINAEDDGVHSDQALSISDGTINIENSYEGLEGLTVAVSGGEITLVASDDGINAAGDSGTPDITISGGSVQVNAQGDGVDSNGTLTISGGTIRIDGPTSGGDSPIDYETSAVITGGNLIAIGSADMVESFGDSSTQPIITRKVDSQQAGTTITLADSEGNELLSWESAKTYQCVILSCADLTVGEDYTLTAGTFEETFTLDSTVYGDSGMFGMGGMGNMGGKGGMMGGGQGQTPDGDSFDPTDGDFTMPDGTTPDGTELPDGETPTMPDSDFTLPEGETPTLPDGTQPTDDDFTTPDGNQQMPGGQGGGMPQGGDGQQPGGQGQTSTDQSGT
jgi:hypothetical protein